MNPRAVFAVSILPLGLAIVQIPIIGAELLTAIMALVFVVSGARYAALLSVGLLLSNISGLEQVFGMGSAVWGTPGGVMLTLSVFVLGPALWVGTSYFIVKVPFLQGKKIRKMFATLRLLRARWKSVVLSS